MSFDVAAEAYDGFMGRYSRLLSGQLAGLASVRSGQRVLDVGCGTGALTGELVARLGPAAVAAVDPSESFVAATRARYPGVDVRQAPAEQLPFPNNAFDVALAQLVVHFMKDPVAGLAEMSRVTQPNGIVAACVWDHGGGQGPLRVFWDAARALDPAVDDESHLPGTREGHLAELFEAAGLHEIEAAELLVRLEHPTFDAWWEPFTHGVGPAGAYLSSLEPDRRTALREDCRRRILSEPFVVTAVAWAARGLGGARPGIADSAAATTTRGHRRPSYSCGGSRSRTMSSWPGPCGLSSAFATSLGRWADVTTFPPPRPVHQLEGVASEWSP